MRKGLVRGGIGLGVLLVLVIAALLIIPIFIDANQYKVQVTDKVRELTGRDLMIDGDLSLSLFPSPALSVGGVRFGNMAGGLEPDMVRMESLKVRLAWLPLLVGTIDVSRIDLVKPDILIEKTADDRTNLQFDTAGSQKTEAAPDQAQPGATPEPAAQSSSGGPDVVIGGVRLIDGRVRYVDHGAGTMHRLDHINVTFSMDSFEGPFDLDGSFAYMGLPITVTARTESLKKTPTPFTVGVGFADQGEILTMDGQLIDAMVNPQVRGRIRVELKQANKAAADIARAFGAPAIVAPLAMHAPLTIKGDLDGGLEHVRVENLSIAVGSTDIKGRVAVDLGKIIKATVDLTATKIDLDDWTRYPQDKDAAVPVETPAPTTGSPAATKTEDTEESFLLPTNIDATLTVSADAVLYKGQAIRDVKLAAALAPTGQLTISTVSALLPGSSSLGLRGSMANAPGGAQVGLGMRVASDDLRAFLKWLEVDVSAVPPEQLRTFSLTTQASGSLSQVKLVNTALQLDGTTGTGAGTLRLGGRPSMDLSLTFDGIDVDAYLPSGDAGAKAVPVTGTTTGSLQTPTGAPLLGALGALNTFDAAFDVRVTSLTAMKANFENVALKGALTQGLLTLEPPTGYTRGIGGTALTVSGGLRGFGGDPVFENTTVTVRAPSAQALIDVVAPSLDKSMFGDLPGGPVGVGVNLKGTLSALGVGASASIAGLEVKASGNLANVGSSVPSDLAFNVDVAHPDFVRMVRLVSKDYTPAQAVGAFKMTSGVSVALDAAGGPSRLVLSDLKASIGRNTIGAALDVNLAGQKPGVTGNIALGAFNIDALLPGGGGKSTGTTASGGGGGGGSARTSERWSSTPLDLSALSSVDADLGLTAQSLTVSGLTVTSLDTRLTLKDGTLSIPQLNGSLYGGKLGGNLTVASKPINSIRLTLSAADVSVQQYLAATGEGQSRVTGTADLKTDITTQGASIAALVGALSGNGSVGLSKIDISAFSGTGEGKIAGSLLKLLSALNKVGSLGGITSNAVDVAAPFQISQGVVTLTPPLSVTSPLYNGAMSGTINLPLWTINTQGEVTLSQTMLGGILKKGLKVPDKVPFGLTGSLDSPKVALELGSLGSGTVGDIVEENVGKLIDKKLDKALPGASGVLQNLRGGDSGAEGTQNSGSRGRQIEDAAKGLLKGLR